MREALDRQLQEKAARDGALKQHESNCFPSNHTASFQPAESLRVWSSHYATQRITAQEEARVSAHLNAPLHGFTLIRLLQPPLSPFQCVRSRRRPTSGRSMRQTLQRRTDGWHWPVRTMRGRGRRLSGRHLITRSRPRRATVSRVSACWLLSADLLTA